MGFSLLLDTTIQGVSMGFVDMQVVSGIAWQGRCLERNGSAQQLSSLFENGCAELSLVGSDIHRICVSTGPGSFTGIKVGLAWLQGIAAGLKLEEDSLKYINVASVTVAACELMRLPKHGSRVSFCMRSTKTHGFLAEYHLSGSSDRLDPLKILPEITETGEDRGIVRLVDIVDGDFLDHLAESCQSNGRIVIGGDWEELATKLTSNHIDFVCLDHDVVADLVLLGMEKLVRNTPSRDWSTSLGGPNYMRKSTAEERLDSQKKV